MTCSFLSLNEALDVAAQVAGALCAAHASGITHRDIKPENVMLRPDSYVKVLDFGLAKLTERSAVFGCDATETYRRTYDRHGFDSDLRLLTRGGDVISAWRCAGTFQPSVTSDGRAPLKSLTRYVAVSSLLSPGISET